MRLCCRMGSFHERVACIQDRGVGQGSGRANLHLDWQFGLDVQPVGLLCGSVDRGSTWAFVRLVSQSTFGAARSQIIVENAQVPFLGYGAHLGTQ